MQFYGEVSFSDQRFERGNSLFPLVRFPQLPVDNPGVQNDLARRAANLAASGSPLAPAAGLSTAPGQFDDVTFFGRALGFTPDDTGSDLRPVDTDTREFSSVYRGILGVTGDINAESNWICTTFADPQRAGQSSPRHRYEPAESAECHPRFRRARLYCLSAGPGSGRRGM
ncbi:MAG: hypothetical protein U5Q16_00780 [Gammaproteobacteria bacterium]|nr:hypothetical protein [Gammaproteobacteria bacterium]